MDITPYIENLRRDLVAAADVGGAEVKDLTHQHTPTTDPHEADPADKHTLEINHGKSL